jgi:hypothetical protein
MSQDECKKRQAIEIALEEIRSSSPALAQSAAISMESIDADSLRTYGDAFAAAFEE